MSQENDEERQVPSDVEHLEQLQAENESLRRQLDALRAAGEDRQDHEQRLREHEQANLRLREELADKALAEAVRTAADEVGLDTDLAMLQSHRFTCQVNDEGVARIEPNPTETFLRLSRTDPMFRRISNAVAEQRKHRAAVNQAAAVDATDAVDLIGYLDRNPNRRYEFIRRHGRDSFFKLLRTAKRRGYRRR